MDFTYLKIIGWGWYYLLTVMDDYSRYIIDWKLFTSMGTADVKELLDRVIEKTGVHNVPIRFRPRVLSDNVLTTESSSDGDDILPLLLRRSQVIHPHLSATPSWSSAVV
jgi:transposase InsO family protein